MNTVSIIVPVYNAQKYIRACLNSILKQTCPDYEVILVDDGSSDASGRICDHYAGRDERITVFHRENKGVSAARNFGLAHATGKYILFADADDTMDPYMLEGCVRLAQDNEADLVICSFHYHMADDEMVENSLGTEVCVTGEELFEHWFCTLMEKEILNPPWNKLIKKALLEEHHIRFHEKFSICEDMAFSIQTIAASKRTVLTGRMYYNYYLKSSGTLVYKFHENYFEALTNYYKAALEYCGKFRDNSGQLRALNTLYVNLATMHLKQICTRARWNRRTKYAKMKKIKNNPWFLSAVKSANPDTKKKLVCFLLLTGQYPLIYILYRVKNEMTTYKPRKIE